MTNRERILSNNTLIDEAIEKANSLSNSGSSGAADIKTCNVILAGDGIIAKVICCVFEDGEKQWKVLDGPDYITIENVLCDSALLAIGQILLNPPQLDNATCITTYTNDISFIITPTNQGETCTITFIAD